MSLDIHRKLTTGLKSGHREQEEVRQLLIDIQKVNKIKSKEAIDNRRELKLQIETVLTMVK